MQWIVFAIISIILTTISWKSLSHPRSHGFYRFFAWECILILFLLNVSHWFENPFVWHQIIAWILLSISLVPLGYGIYYLKTRGKPATNREGDASLLSFEKTTSMVKTGIYKHIRHPLYCSLLFLAWGIFFKLPSITGIALTAVATTFLFATAKTDETECIKFFGAQYVDYMKSTKMFIPYVW